MKKMICGKKLRCQKNENNSAERYAAEIGEDQKQIELITFAHFQKVRELCNDDQKKKFDEVIQEALKSMGPRESPSVFTIRKTNEK